MPFSDGHALLIGVGSHTYAPHLDVPISVDDAQAVADILTNEYYCGYPLNQVKVLHDGSATQEGILGALTELANRVKPEDTVTIFYCGHGDYGTDGEYYLVSHDADISGSKVQSGTGVSQAALIEGLGNISAERVLVIFNACHSAEISPTLSVDKVLGSKILPDTAKDALLSSGSGRIIITACKEEQLSYIGKGDLTIFTQALVDSLRGKGIISRGGFISAFDLYTSIYESVNEIVQAAYNTPQEPELTVLKGVGPFAVALYQGAEETNLGLAEEIVEPPQEAAVRETSLEESRRMFQVSSMAQKGQQKWWQQLPDQVGGDVIITEIGAGARGVAAGKNITQSVYGVLGEPALEDLQVIEQEFASLVSFLENLGDQIEAQTAEMAKFQIQILEGELTKTEEDEIPSASSITKVGDWLLENVPDIAEVLTGLFATPAVGRVVGKAGETSVEWVKQRFGKKT